MRRRKLQSQHCQLPSQENLCSRLLPVPRSQLRCYSKRVRCQIQHLPSWPGDTVRIFKCWDQSCATSVDSCPSRVTCTNSQLYCEGQCVDNALQCQQPAQCYGTNSLRCSDGSCANKTSDCPVTQTCGANLALCADGSCKTDCSVTTSASRMRRVLDTTSNTSIYTQFTCPSGDIVSSIYNCPSPQVCGGNTLQCPDGSCVTDLSLCVQRTCAAGTVQCWDGKCETSLARCSSRTTCPDNLPTLCSDGSCQSSASACSDYVECPVYFPYRCGSGEL